MIPSEDVLRMAMESGFMLSSSHGKQIFKQMPVSDSGTLIEFAKLVKNHARREALATAAKVCDDHGASYLSNLILNLKEDTATALGQTSIQQEQIDSLSAKLLLAVDFLKNIQSLNMLHPKLDKEVDNFLNRIA